LLAKKKSLGILEGDGRIILKLILEIWVVKTWSGTN
jgi:hypothetical protein